MAEGRFEPSNQGAGRSFEALVIARAEHFPSDAVDKARARLEAVGMDLGRVCAYWRAP